MIHYFRRPNKLIDLKLVRSKAQPLLAGQARVRSLCSFKVKAPIGYDVKYFISYNQRFGSISF